MRLRGGASGREPARRSPAWRRAAPGGECALGKMAGEEVGGGRLAGQAEFAPRARGRHGRMAMLTRPSSQATPPTVLHQQPPLFAVTPSARIAAWRPEGLMCPPVACADRGNGSPLDGPARGRGILARSPSIVRPSGLCCIAVPPSHMPRQGRPQGEPAHGLEKPKNVVDMVLSVNRAPLTGGGRRVSAWCPRSTFLAANCDSKQPIELIEGGAEALKRPCLASAPS